MPSCTFSGSDEGAKVLRIFYVIEKKNHPILLPLFGNLYDLREVGTLTMPDNCHNSLCLGSTCKLVKKILLCLVDLNPSFLCVCDNLFEDCTVRSMENYYFLKVCPSS